MNRRRKECMVTFGQTSTSVSQSYSDATTSAKKKSTTKPTSEFVEKATGVSTQKNYSPVSQSQRQSIAQQSFGGSGRSRKQETKVTVQEEKPVTVQEKVQVLEATPELSSREKVVSGKYDYFVKRDSFNKVYDQYRINRETGAVSYQTTQYGPILGSNLDVDVQRENVVAQEQKQTVKPFAVSSIGFDENAPVSYAEPSRNAPRQLSFGQFAVASSEKGVLYGEGNVELQRQAVKVASAKEGGVISSRTSKYYPRAIAETKEQESFKIKPFNAEKFKMATSVVGAIGKEYAQRFQSVSTNILGATSPETKIFVGEGAPRQPSVSERFKLFTTGQQESMKLGGEIALLSEKSAVAVPKIFQTYKTVPSTTGDVLNLGFKTSGKITGAVEETAGVAFESLPKNIRSGFVYEEKVSGLFPRLTGRTLSTETITQAGVTKTTQQTKTTFGNIYRYVTTSKEGSLLSKTNVYKNNKFIKSYKSSLPTSQQATVDIFEAKPVVSSYKTLQVAPNVVSQSRFQTQRFNLRYFTPSGQRYTGTGVSRYRTTTLTMSGFEQTLKGGTVVARSQTGAQLYPYVTSQDISASTLQVSKGVSPSDISKLRTVNVEGPSGELSLQVTQTPVKTTAFEYRSVSTGLVKPQQKPPRTYFSRVLRSKKAEVPVVSTQRQTEVVKSYTPELKPIETKIGSTKIPIGSSTYYPSRVSTKLFGSVSISQRYKPTPALSTKPSAQLRQPTTYVYESKVSTVPVQVPKLKAQVSYAQLPKTRNAQSAVSQTAFAVARPAVPTIGKVPAPAFPISVPKLDFGVGSSDRSSPVQSVFKATATKYTPTYYSAGLRIKGKALTGTLTGLEMRGVL